MTQRVMQDYLRLLEAEATPLASNGGRTGSSDSKIEFKLKWTAHIASATYHEKADATNALTYNPANRTLATVVAAAQEIFDKMATHILTAPISHAFRAEA